MKTLEAYLLDAEHKGVVDHAFRMTRGPGGEVRIVLHPADVDGETLDLEVRGDTVSQPFMVFDSAEMVEGPALATKDDVASVLREVAALRQYQRVLPA